jgi:hypothetical protein
MEIEGTTFSTITIDGKTYEHDVIIRLSGEVVKRKKKLSKKYYGTSHVLSKDEAKFVFESGCEQLILGSGQRGNVHLSPEAEAYFAKKGCKVLLQCERSRAGSHLGRGKGLQPNYGVVSSRSSVPNICTRQTNSLASVSKASPEPGAWLN